MKHDVHKLIAKLNQSEELACSPVAFVLPLVKDAMLGKIDKRTFRTEYKQQTKEAQFVFFHMPKAQIEENRSCFAQEFLFADALTTVMKATYYADMAEADLKVEVRKCVEDYLASRA